MHNYFCGKCGCALDPGEKCDCERGSEEKLVTYEDWEAAGSFSDCAKPGDLVEERIVDEFLNCVPPASHRAGYIQCGEPYSSEYDTERDRWRSTFATFAKTGEHWRYCGNCFIGATEEPRKAERRPEA